MERNNVKVTVTYGEKERGVSAITCL